VQPHGIDTLFPKGVYGKGALTTRLLSSLLTADPGTGHLTRGRYDSGFITVMKKRMAVREEEGYVEENKPEHESEKVYHASKQDILLTEV
jgi:hypothetical protein